MAEAFRGHNLQWMKALKSAVITKDSRVELVTQREHLKLYWEIGHAVINREQQGFGVDTFRLLSRMLKHCFPQGYDFDYENMMKMRDFATTWPRLEDELYWNTIGWLSWEHQLLLLDRVGDWWRRMSCAQRSLENGWCHRELESFLDQKPVIHAPICTQGLSNTKVWKRYEVDDVLRGRCLSDHSSFNAPRAGIEVHPPS